MFECADEVGTFVPGDLQQCLKDICNEREGERVKQEDIMEILGITDDLCSKNRLSRALTATFPNCEKKRVLCKDKQIYPLHMV